MLDRPATIGDVVVLCLIFSGITSCLSVLVAEGIDALQEKSGQTQEKLDEYARRAWGRRRKP